MSQLEISFDEKQEPTQPTIASIGFGQLFRIGGKTEVYMKVKPVNFLCNSNLLSDVFARGDCVVVNIKAGTVFVKRGNTGVIKLTGNLKVKRVQTND